ncbi:phosphatidylinositol phosphatase PTPRQ-like isoform X2 [Corticium candelabrum]|uniref:phosphatidylinositol phosphatase PTPRQ-like isoform X2 n=1 Tax=Corticium candelabrum TaxID=121492 RepID=UPI002E26E77C|nr:phosphatidylinositol phosphatase PTPRQ-like isoform X2 [Corticium candelabrum]
MKLKSKVCGIDVTVAASFWLLCLAAVGVAADTLDIRVTSYYTSLTLTWSKPPGKKIQSYNISYGLASQSTIIGYAKRVRGNETHHFVSLDSLTANMTYRITVRWQTNMTLLTAQTLPCSLGHTIKVNVKNESRLNYKNEPLPMSTVNVSWSLESTKTSNTVIKYRVTIRNSRSRIVNSSFTTPTTHSLLIELNHFTHYTATVQAYSNCSVHLLSKTHAFLTDEGLLALPSNFTFVGHTHNAVQVSWLPPSQPNGIVRGYTLSYAKANCSLGHTYVEDASSWVKIAAINATDRVYTITGLTPDTCYACLLAATNKYKGYDTHLDVYTDYAPLAKPSVDITVLSINLVTITWATPDYPDESTLLSFLITVKDAETSGWNSSISLHLANLSSLSYNIGELALRPFHTYSVTVKAVSQTGGQYSSVSGPYSFRTPEDIPGVPIKLEASQTRRQLSEAFLTWEPPLNPNGIITHYEIETIKTTYTLERNGELQMSQESDFSIKMMSNDVNISLPLMPIKSRSIHKVIHLPDATDFEYEYSFKVRAFTSVGAGNYTSEQSMVIHGDGPTPPRLLSVSLDEPSSTATVQWIRPIAGFSSLGQMYYWYLAIYAIKEYRTELGETKTLNDTQGIAIPGNKVETAPTKYEDVKLYAANFSNIFGDMNYFVWLLVGNAAGASHESNGKLLAIRPKAPLFVAAPDVLDEGFQSQSNDDAKVGKVTTSGRMVQLRAVSGINGDIVKYAIIVLQLPTDESKALSQAEPTSPLSSDYILASIKPPYFAFLNNWAGIQFNVHDDKSNDDVNSNWEWFEIGKEDSCEEDSMACNKLLSPGTSYRFKLRAYVVYNESAPNEGVYTDSAYSEACSTKRKLLLAPV